MWLYFFGVLSNLVACVCAKSLWSRQPVLNYSLILQEAYPIGNGRLAALPFGKAGAEQLSINRDSLWSGGPFANTSYRGGLPTHELHSYLPGIRDWIWKNGTGNVTALMGDDNDYGSYQVLANISVIIEGVRDVSAYKRFLDMETGVHTTSFKAGQATYFICTYCSYPDDVCVYDITSTHELPAVRISMQQLQENSSLITSSCSGDQVRLTGTTEVDPGFDRNIGMKYEAITKLVESHVLSSCHGSTLRIPSNGQKELTLVWAAGANFDGTHGTASYNFSFKGVDPHAYVQGAVDLASHKTAKQLLSSHVTDYSTLADAFILDLPDTVNSAGIETAQLVARYANPNATSNGDPFLECLVFDFGRHLFISSSRDNSLPPNLQGKWATALENAWGADYHADINVQMNHWPVDQTGLGGLQVALWNYLVDNWAPRGAEAAQLIYDAPGWVVHDEMNIFGYAAMKTGDAYWANLPGSGAWLMQHVWDYYDYSQNATWLKKQGYPQLLKPIAQFWMDQLQEDEYFKDGTLVHNPCNSPEHGPTTFGCAHSQQLIYQVFDTALASAAVVGDPDHAFLGEVESKLARLDKGLHIGSWGQIQEWKMDIDVRNDTHRHLSHLIGWYPGWAMSSYEGGYTNATIQGAVATTLWSRGAGIIDSNAGWEKVWRSACWARLNNTVEAYYELRLTIFENSAPNLLSMYSGKNEPFQIDANFGFPAAVLSLLVVDLPRLSGGGRGARTVVLGPAIPAAWGGGRVKGLRLRGGGSVDFEWDMDGLVTRATLTGRESAVSVVDKNGKVLVAHTKGYDM